MSTTDTRGGGAAREGQNLARSNYGGQLSLPIKFVLQYEFFCKSNSEGTHFLRIERENELTPFPQPAIRGLAKYMWNCYRQVEQTQLKGGGENALATLPARHRGHASSRRLDRFPWYLHQWDGRRGDEANLQDSETRTLHKRLRYKSMDIPLDRENGEEWVMVPTDTESMAPRCRQLSCKRIR